MCIVTKYLNETDPIRNNGYNKVKHFINFTILTLVQSLSKVSPTIVANVEFQTSKCLNLVYEMSMNIDQKTNQVEVTIIFIDCWPEYRTWLVS